MNTKKRYFNATLRVWCPVWITTHKTDSEGYSKVEKRSITPEDHNCRYQLSIKTFLEIEIFQINHQADLKGKTFKEKDMKVICYSILLLALAIGIESKHYHGFKEDKDRYDRLRKQHNGEKTDASEGNFW